MKNINDRIAALSPEQKALLELRLKQRNLKAKSLTSIPKRQATDVLSLSFSQERFWVLHQLQPDLPLYNEINCFHLIGKLNINAIEKSFYEILQRHEVLRTKFVTFEGRPIQVIETLESFSLPIIDLSYLPESDRHTQALQLATQLAQQPFNLAEDTLCRIKLIHLSSEEHILLFTAHHIVCDGWSTGIFIRELTALYAAFCTGKPSGLPELPIQYSDYALWQRQWLQGEVLETQLAYWKKQLGGTLPVLELPTNRSHSQIEKVSGATQSLQLSASLTQALKNLSQQQGVTLFMTLLAAFKVLLYRYTNVTDILVGSPIANRNRAELEGLIGLFINTLVLRTDLSGNPVFTSLLKRVQEVAINAYAHQDLPFEKLVDELQPTRSLSRNPLFQVMFQLRSVTTPPLELPGLTVNLLDVKTDTTHFDLSLDIEEVEEKLKAVIEYNTDLFDTATITRMLGHFQTLLEGIVANPDENISNLPLLTAAEQQQILVWNQTQTDFSANSCIHQLFEAQVELTPDAIAVVFESQELTYRELNQKANQLGNYLQKLGVEPESLVGICIERSPLTIIAILGVLKAGGAYLPLDPAYPQQRLELMLADAQAPILLTQQHLLGKLSQSQTQVICLDADWQIITQESQENLVINVTSVNLAYVIYTSGSTGKPKGVMIAHQSLINYVQAAIKEYNISVGDRVLQFASLSFDTSAEEIFPCLATGATLVLRTDEMIGSIAQFLQKCRDWQLTILDLPTAYWHELTHALEEEKLKLPASVRLIIIGGEKALPDRVSTWQKCVDNSVRLVNTYGPTETTIVATKYDLSIQETFNCQATNIPIGKPIPNAQTYILDSHLQLVPIGIPGELYIGGVGLAKGYLNRSELTIDKFINNPFIKAKIVETGLAINSNSQLITSIQDLPVQQSPKLYKTGDLVRYLPDGNIEYLGRIDDQVKVRGFRIELGEIEAALREAPAVKETVVLVSDDTNHKKLVAYIVPKVDREVNTSDLRNFLKVKLPDYMVPAAFVLLDELPLTPNGKVDKQALPAAEYRINSTDNLVSPRTLIEELLVKIWSQVLGLEKVSIYDNFFEIGGDSILSIQVVAKANQQGLRLTPKQLFQHQTIAELATVVDTSQVILAEQGLVSGSVPLTPIQQWFFQQDLQNPHHWNQSLLLEVRQDINCHLLEKAVEQLLVHHDALRLRFISEVNGWQQINITTDTKASLRQIDLSMLTEREQVEALEKAAYQLQASLDLSQGPLVRLALFNLGDRQSNLLLIVIHHLVVDGVSWRILMEDLQTVYQQLCNGKDIALPAKTTSFKQWSEKLQNYAQSEQLQQELEFWLHKIPKQVPQLATDNLKGANTVSASCTVTKTLNILETKALLQEVPTAYRTEINDVLLTALVQTFTEFTGQASLLIDLEGHGREDIFDDIDLSRTVGWFTSVFPVFLTINETATLGEAIQTIKEQLRQIPNRGIGYGLLRYISQHPYSQQLKLCPQPEISFNYLGQVDGTFSPSSMFSLAKESSTSNYNLEDKRAYLLEIDSLITNGELQMVWTYSNQIYQSSTIENLAASFIEKLRSLITYCQSPDVGGYTPSDFPLAQLSQDELNAALANVEFT